jgi:hypothetical protein
LADRKKELLNEIRGIQQKFKTTEKHIKAETLSVTTSDMSEYYLNSFMQIIHIFLTVEKYARDIDLISKRLGLSHQRITEILKKLELLQIIQFRKDRYFSIKDNIHLPPESPLYSSYRTMMRLRALEQTQKLKAGETYNFSVIFSTTPEAKEKIHKNFLDFLTATQKLVSGSKEREVYQMNFDLFNWSGD